MVRRKKSRKQRGGKYGFVSAGLGSALDTAISYNSRIKELSNHEKMKEFYRNEALAPIEVRKNRNKALQLYQMFLNKQAIKRKAFYKKYGHLLKKKKRSTKQK